MLVDCACDDGVVLSCLDSACRAKGRCAHPPEDGRCEGEEWCDACDGEGAVEVADHLDDLDGDGLVDPEMFDEWEVEARCCRECGCSDDLACSPTCCWTEHDLCCQCALDEGQVCPHCGAHRFADDDPETEPEDLEELPF